MAIFDPKAKVIAGYQRTIDEKKKAVLKCYDEIGRLYYGQYKDMSVDVTKDINSRCEAVSTLQKEIRDLELKILFEKGLKVCANCGKENMLAYAFCFGCGTKFPDGEEENKEVKETSTPVVEVAATEEDVEVEEEADTEASEDATEETVEEVAEEEKKDAEA